MSDTANNVSSISDRAKDVASDVADKAKAAGSSALGALKRAARSEAAVAFVQCAAMGAGVMAGMLVVTATYNAITK